MKQRFGVAVALLGDPKLMIVDEPTAGLDPAERVRFLNLLSELGENSVVLLSTHIVEDVSELCTRMAIIDRGEILLEAEPLRAIDELRGRIWRGVISKEALPGLEREHAVISTKAARGAHRRAHPRRRASAPGLRGCGARSRGRLLLHAGRSHRRAPRATRAGGAAVKFRAIFRFELAYQTRRAWLWLIFVALIVFAFLIARDGELAQMLYSDFFVNSPFAIAKTTVAGGIFWLLMAAAVAGEAAARDVATGMHPLTYTAPVSKAAYLGGRFLAAFVINAALLLAVQAGIVLAVYLPGVHPDLIGPFRPAALSDGLLLPRAAERVHRDGAPVLAGDAERSRDVGLPRERAAPLHGHLRRLDAGLPSRHREAAGPGRHALRPRRSVARVDDDREELAPDRARRDGARESTHLARRRSRAPRAHLPRLSLRAPDAEEHVVAQAATPCHARPDSHAPRCHGERADLRPGGRADIRFRAARAPDARHRVDVVPDDRDEPRRARHARVHPRSSRSSSSSTRWRTAASCSFPRPRRSCASSRRRCPPSSAAG
jgi:hypothetical protein